MADGIGPKTSYRFDPFEFDSGSGELTTPSGVVVLQPQPALLLEVLLSRAGRVVSREELYEALWPNTKVEFDLGLNAAVRNLRKSLGDDAVEPRYIETIRRRGYRWIAPIRPVEPALPTPGKVGGRRMHRIAAAALAAAVALLVVRLLVDRQAVPPPQQPRDEPRIAQLRYLLDHGDEQDVARALAELRALPWKVRNSEQGLALAADLLYAQGNGEEAELAARAALALNDEQAGPRRVLGLLHLYRDRDPARALAVISAAVDSGAESSDLLHAYGVALAAQGRFREAMVAMRRALVLDPVSPNLTFDGWLVAYLARDFGTSRVWCADLGRLTGDDNPRCHFLATLAAGQRQEAARLAERFLSERRIGVMATEGAPDSVLDAYWRWDLERSRDHLPPAQRAFGEARALAQLGRQDEALERLTVAAAGGAPEMVFARHLPYFDPLADDPRFGEATGRLRPERSDEGGPR